MASIHWNQQVRLIISDVDETVADLYTDAVPAMGAAIQELLEDGLAIMFVSGQSLTSIQQRVIRQLDPALRQRVLVGHCSGAEVWGFDARGQLAAQFLYSRSCDTLTPAQQRDWRAVIDELLVHFGLRVFPVMPLWEFKRAAGDDPLAVMLEDRGPQITIEFVNGYDLRAQGLPQPLPGVAGQPHDLRDPIIDWAAARLLLAGVPITPRRAGVFAVDFALAGVSKTTAVRAVLQDTPTLERLGLAGGVLEHPEAIEIWGDKFAVRKGGTDFAMCAALSPAVRAITFRDEDVADLPEGYNIVRWDGAARLHEGLLEYLQARRTDCVFPSAIAL